MSVYIKGMEMPTRCEDCFCYRHNAEYDYAYCNISSVNVRGHGNARLVSCPLVPVPDHGRLIDADALCKLCNNSIDHSVTPNDIMRMPIIIPADKDGVE